MCSQQVWTVPNVKVYVDEGVLPAVQDRSDTVLVGLRRFLCEALGVTEAACHIVLIGVKSLPGQTPVNVELVLLRRQDRTGDTMTAFCSRLRDLMTEWLGCQTAIRCTLMETDLYFVSR